MQTCAPHPAQVAALVHLAVGDVQGHEFRGNQYTDNSGAQDANDRLAQAEENRKTVYDALIDPGAPLPGDVEVDWPEIATEQQVRLAKGEVATALGARLEETSALEELRAYHHEDPWSAPLGPFLNASDDDHEMKILAEATAGSLVHQWATSAADSEARSLALQEAASTLWNLDSPSFQEHLREVDMPGVSVETAQFGDLFRSFHEAQYVATQDRLANAGLKPDDPVTLYRGFNDVTGVLEDQEPYTTFPMDANPLSSWTTDKGVAEQFSGPSGYVLRSEVPVKDIVGSPHTGQGALNEQEIVVRDSADRRAMIIKEPE